MSLNSDLSFESLPKDLVVLIASYLKNPYILKLSMVNKKFYNYITKNKYFWISKLIKDFPHSYNTNITKQNQLNKNNWRRLYIENAKNKEIRLKISLFNFINENNDITSDRINLYEMFSFYYGCDLQRIRNIIHIAINKFIKKFPLDVSISIKINGSIVYADEIILKRFTKCIDTDTHSITMYLNSDDELDHTDLYLYQELLEYTVTKSYQKFK